MQNTELDCLARIRHAIGDNGKRMQPELVEYIRATFESERRLRELVRRAKGFVGGYKIWDELDAALKIIPK